jgi:hypothetical protein
MTKLKKYITYVVCFVFGIVSQAHSQVVDKLTTKQAVASARVGFADASQVTSKTERWHTRKFKAYLQSSCTKQPLSQIALGNANNGVIYFESTNAAGYAEIQWSFDSSAWKDALGLGRISFDVALSNVKPLSKEPPSVSVIVSVRSEQGSMLLPAQRISFTSSGSQKVSLDLLKGSASSALIKPHTIVLHIESEALCDGRIAISSMNFEKIKTVSPLAIRHLHAPRGGIQRAQAGGMREAFGQSSNVSPSPSTTPTQAFRKCGDDPAAVSEEILQCEVEASQGCAERKCECNNYIDQDYKVEIDHSKSYEKSVGAECFQTDDCEGRKGRCNGQRECVPPLLYDLDPEDTELNGAPHASCVNVDIEPVVNFDLCNATVEQAVSLVRAFLLPAGTPCGNQNERVCNHTGQCVDPSACEVHAPACSPCKLGHYSGYCHEGYCLTPTAFETINCQGYSHPCRECKGEARCNPSGPSYAVFSARSGETCETSKKQPGICKQGSCVPLQKPTPTPSPRK